MKLLKLPRLFFLCSGLCSGLYSGLCFGLGAPVAMAVSDRAILAEVPPLWLSEYRLFAGYADALAQRPVAGVHPYAPRNELFADYAGKRRFLYLPGGGKIRYRARGRFDFPPGAALIKTFVSPAGELLETRLLLRHPDGWRARTYVWDPAVGDARLALAGRRLPVRWELPPGGELAFTYRVPNQNQCKHCHQVDGRIEPIGPRARQLDFDFAYPDGAANQLQRWAQLGLFANYDPAAPIVAPPAWDDPAAPVDARARAYLDMNCGHCHSPRGVASNSGLYLDLDATDPVALGIGKRPAAAGRGSLGWEFAIEPGHPERSILLLRMRSTDPDVRMPEVGRSLVHAEAVALVSRWIASMD